MRSEKAPAPRQPLAIRVAIAVMALLALSGIAMIGNGLYILARAEFSRASHTSGVAHHLADFRIIDAQALAEAQAHAPAPAQASDI